MMQFRRPMLTAAVGATAVMSATTAAAFAADELVERPTSDLDPVVRLSDRAHDRAVRDHVRLYRVNQRLRGVEVDGNRYTEVADWTTHHLRERNRELRADNRRERRENRSAQTAGSGAVATGGSTASAGLESIAACESGGDPGAVSPDGTYRGKYQFDQQTWQSVGGSGDPAAAPEAEQDKRAAMLQAQSGSSPWPVCG